MARKPAHLVSTARRSGGRQGIWEAMRMLRRFTRVDVALASREESETVQTYLQSLLKAGYLALVATEPSRVHGQRQAHIYELVNDVGVEAPRVRRDGSPCTQGRPREQMWRAMKLLDSFTPRDLAIGASTDEQPVSEVDAADYVKHLARAGYLVVVEPAKAPLRQARYRFVRSRNSGPRPPQVQRLKTVFDANLRKVVWQEEPAE